MFLWELKNSIISQNLRELCVIETPKPNRKIPPTVASTSSATVLFITTHAALACRRHIISIVLKSVCFLEHLWCSFENSKTPSFHKISVNFVILKQIQKIHTQWLRQAQPPILPLHGACACRSHIISIALKFVCSIEHLRCSFGNSKTPPLHKISVNFVILKQIQKIYTQWLRELRSQTFSLCSTTNSSITRCLSVVEGTFSLLIPLPEPVEGTFSILISVPEPVEGTLFLLH